MLSRLSYRSPISNFARNIRSALPISYTLRRMASTQTIAVLDESELKDGQM
jgi:hypothetical protein